MSDREKMSREVKQRFKQLSDCIETTIRSADGHEIVLFTGEPLTDEEVVELSQLSKAELVLMCRGMKEYKL